MEISLTVLPMEITMMIAEKVFQVVYGEQVVHHRQVILPLRLEGHQYNHHMTCCMITRVREEAEYHGTLSL